MKEHKNEKGEKRKNDGEKRGNKERKTENMSIQYVYILQLNFIE